MERRAFFFGLVVALSVRGGEFPRRIVSLSPDVTEMLYGMGAFGQVVGVSDYCTYPPEAARLPSVGGWANPSLEKLAALRPDLVVTDVAQGAIVEPNIKAVGLKLLTVPDRGVNDVYVAMGELGRATGHEEAAAKLIATTREGLQAIARRVAGRPVSSVILIIDRTPGTLADLYTVSAGSYLAELVTIAGGRIAAPKDQRGYGKLSKEDLLAINPDVILDFVHGAPSRLAADPIEPWREMPELKAVQTHRVYGVNEEYVPHASQRMVKTAELFARLIHSEIK